MAAAAPPLHFDFTAWIEEHGSVWEHRCSADVFVAPKCWRSTNATFSVRQLLSPPLWLSLIPSLGRWKLEVGHWENIIENALCPLNYRKTSVWADLWWSVSLQASLRVERLLSVLQKLSPAAVCASSVSPPSDSCLGAQTLPPPLYVCVPPNVSPVPRASV